ncbi:esterase-like activity of phytase family protein [Pontivivens ytuae]|uniref:Esterase-like activity of phytase family protein n=1 Tax=Pontivivens ytuae TaxID=2789856 RepID=A0A7S9LTU0_9RHOB|nr:esterase-like activity of phytase family protein [Pontivivens ytuae]QPH55009.1 esterase-like activity of phytase family protein [Pontivivens ytuae]
MIIRATGIAALMLGVALPAHAQVFNRIASFDVSTQEGTDASAETAPEIIAATADGMTLVYTDSPAGVLGMIDITDPAAPAGMGTVALDGEPTSVALSNDVILAGVNTSEDFVNPSGHLLALSIDGEELARCDLGGQPDSIAATDSIVAVAIENERDEDLDDGVIPQLPAGNVTIYPLEDGVPQCDSVIVADVTGLAETAPTDPEPEFLDINGNDEIVVSLQENNHMVVISAAGEVLSHFSAGGVDLENIDTIEEGAIVLNGSQPNRLREPDAVKWFDDVHFITANEGDYEGGSRGWTVFNRDGTVVYEDGTGLEYAMIRAGHYPDERSGNKGVEPESVEVGTFGGTPMAFIGSERGSIVGVYDMTDPAAPALAQLLPSGIAPEGLLALPDRNLLVTANEADLVEDGGVRAHVMIYEFGDETAVYPTIVSGDDTDGLPIGWGALSGLVADEADAGTLYAVSDSFYGGAPAIFSIDATQTPALITTKTIVTREDLGAAQKLDLEGIATDGEGGFWLASEGRMDRNIPHALYHVDGEGVIQDEIPLPEALRDVDRRFGMEGVTRDGGMLYIAMQREWRDDPEGQVKIVRYDIEAEEWAAVAYPLESGEQGWVGLSEITASDGQLFVVERDNQIGSNAAIKRLYTVSLDGLEFAELGTDLPVVEKSMAHDFLPQLASYNGFVVDKIEGFAIAADGTRYAVTDNDGVDDSSGETFFFVVE